MTLEEQIAQLQEQLSKANADLNTAKELNDKYAKQAEETQKTLDANKTKIENLEAYKFDNILAQNGIKKDYAEFVKTHLKQANIDLTSDKVAETLKDKKYNIFKNNNIIDSDNLSQGANEKQAPEVKKELSEEDIAKIQIQI